jgi:hypothetical protein
VKDARLSTPGKDGKHAARRGFRYLSLSGAIASLLVLSLPAAEALAGNDGRAASDAVAPARPGAVAVREEFEAALKSGSEKSLHLFLRRHPEGLLAEAAKKARDRLKARHRPRPR